MSSLVIFSTVAAKEIQETFEWYENLEDGLGNRFVEVIDKIIEIITHYPKSFPCKKGSFREASVKKFPYLIIYEYSFEDEKIYILHIFHSHRHPKRKYQRKK